MSGYMERETHLPSGSWVIVRCRGRDAERKPVLDKPVNATVRIRRFEDGESISLSVDCPHNTGSHGQRCMASHPGQEGVGDGVSCPYACDIPWCFDNR